MHNLFAVWKPVGPTSNAVLNRIRKIAGTKKVGHAGTLDPLAEGVLVVGIGREATKQLSSAVAKEKEYGGTIRLGITSTTDDAEGEKTEIFVANPPSDTVVHDIVQKFVGTIEQIPPQFSAVKVGGREAYKLARKGKKVSLRARSVCVKSIDCVYYAWPELQIRVVSGPGVYIRSLARDIGEKLGTGAYLTALVRTRVGEWTRENALTLDELSSRF